MDPNREVEGWKDALYNDFKKVPKTDLANYFEKGAEQILQKNNIKCIFTKVIKKPEFVSDPAR
jgi:hypothetical protein